MDYKSIENLIKAVSESALSEFELQSGDINIKMKKNIGEKSIQPAAGTSEVELKNAAAVEIPVEKVVEKKDENLSTITSPIVGTFYGAPSPGALPYAAPGSKIKKGDTLCIIEAMKLMNEIESEVDGEIVEVMAADGQMVEFNQPLFTVRTQEV